MEITLRLDDALIERARDLAERRQTSLDELFGELLRQATGAAAIEEFLRLAAAHGACSAPGWRFDRDACHDRSAHE